MTVQWSDVMKLLSRGSAIPNKKQSGKPAEMKLSTFLLMPLIRLWQATGVIHQLVRTQTL